LSIERIDVISEREKWTSDDLHVTLQSIAQSVNWFVAPQLTDEIISFRNKLGDVLVIIQKVFTYFGSIKVDYIEIGNVVHNLFNIFLGTNNVKTHQEILKLLHNFRRNSAHGVDSSSSIVRDAWREKNLVFINSVCEKCLQVLKSEDNIVESINLAILNGFEGLSLPYEMTCKVIGLLNKIWLSEHKQFLLKDRFFFDYLTKLITALMNQRYSEFIFKDQIIINFISNVFPELHDSDNLVITLVENFNSLVSFLGQTLTTEAKQAIVTNLIVYYTLFPIFFKNPSIKEKLQKQCHKQLATVKKLVLEKDINGWGSVQDIANLNELVKRLT